MKKSITSIFFLAILFMVTSCGDTKNNKLIIGNWQALQWLKNGQPSNYKIEGTAFTFNDKGEYTFNYDGTLQKGTYKVENDMLFTTAEKQQEIMVNITKISPDSLVLDMNREGQLETIFLLKKK